MSAARALAVLALALAAPACGGERPSGAVAKSYATHPVAGPAVAALEEELSRSEPPGGAEPPERSELGERIEGLLATLVSSRDALRRVALEELSTIGGAAVAPLSARLSDRGRDVAQRLAAAEGLAALDVPAAGAALLAVLESSRTALEPEPWLYAQCAWRLGETNQDWTVPRAILCLRYEQDHETVVFLARTLARFGNYAGLDGLHVVAASTPSPDVRARAEQVSRELAEARGLADAEALRALWEGGDPEDRLAAGAPSARRRLEVWRIIRGFAEWQLRGVDDGRFVLARESSFAAGLLGEALRDENPYVRAHSAQCLERMGPRARAAGPALLEALDDPAAGVGAIAALGGLRFEPARARLEALLAPSAPLEARVAAARALGALGRIESEAALALLLAAAEPLEVRSAAAESIARVQRARAPGEVPSAALGQAVRLLARLLTSREVDPAPPERALQEWLWNLRARGEERARPAAEEWHALRDAPEAERLARRAEVLTRALPALAGPP